MTYRFKYLAAVLPILALGGCNSFLTGDKLSGNPNIPQQADRYLLLDGIQATQFASQTGALARAYSIWTQQFSGTDRQYIDVEEYNITADDFSGTFTSTYAGGGLLDIRKMEADADKVGDRKFRGIGEVWEALTIGTAATVWGDVPYRQAVDSTIRTPKLDPQAQVFADVQKVLDSAIVHLGQAGEGPGPYDLIYNASSSNATGVQNWIRAAHTLKARYYMHMAEKDPSNYARVIAEANQGIASPAGDFTTYQSATPGEENLWYQFMFRERDTYIRAGFNLVELLRARGDNRLTDFFRPTKAGTIVGAMADSGDVSASVLSYARGAANFRQPVVTWEENVLLRAEAEYQTGALAAARTDLNSVRTLHGVAASTATGTALLHDILEEEYIALFQNIEVMALYARTCYPNLEPVGGGSIIPRRVYYGSAEMNANPNIPSEGEQNLFNPNDKAGGTYTTAIGAACLGQVAGAP